MNRLNILPCNRPIISPRSISHKICSIPTQNVDSVHFSKNVNISVYSKGEGSIKFQCKQIEEGAKFQCTDFWKRNLKAQLSRWSKMYRRLGRGWQIMTKGFLVRWKEKNKICLLARSPGFMWMDLEKIATKGFSTELSSHMKFHLANCYGKVEWIFRMFWTPQGNASSQKTFCCIFVSLGLRFGL